MANGAPSFCLLFFVYKGGTCFLALQGWLRDPKDKGTVLSAVCVSVQLLSRVRLFAAAWTAALPVHPQLPELARIHVHPVSDAIQPSHPLLSPSPSFNLSQHQGLFQWVSWCPKYWSFSFGISPSNEYSGLISFRMDWFYLLAVQGTLKSLLQHHSSKASVLQCSGFFMVQLSHP